MTSPSSAASGMSKREFFAGLALVGMTNSDIDWSATPMATADRAVTFADALIEALNATNTPDQCGTADAE